MSTTSRDLSPDEPLAGLDLLRAAHDRAEEAEGIPMVLALVSEADPVPAPTAPGALADGAQLLARMDAVRAAALPDLRDGDMGAVVSVLAATAYADAGQQAHRL